MEFSILLAQNEDLKATHSLSIYELNGPRKEGNQNYLSAEPFASDATNLCLERKVAGLIPTDDKVFSGHSSF